MANVLVVAAYAGRVTAAGYDEDNTPTEGYGCRAKIDHKNGYETVYGHLREGSLTVSVGDYVQQGEIIGVVGSTGNSSGDHLHFEVRHNGIPIDPEPLYADAPIITPPPDWQPPDVTPPPPTEPPPAEAYPPLDRAVITRFMRVIRPVEIRTWPYTGTDDIIVGRLKPPTVIEVLETCVGTPGGLWVRHKLGYSAVSYYGTVFMVETKGQ